MPPVVVCCSAKHNASKKHAIVMRLRPQDRQDAALNVLEHRWMLLTVGKEHETLPKYVKLLPASNIQGLMG